MHVHVHVHLTAILIHSISLFLLPSPPPPPPPPPPPSFRHVRYSAAAWVPASSISGHCRLREPQLSRQRQHTLHLHSWSVPVFSRVKRKESDVFLKAGWSHTCMAMVAHKTHVLFQIVHTIGVADGPAGLAFARPIISADAARDHAVLQLYSRLLV